MPSAAELRAELKQLRNEMVKPITKMKKGDISTEIEKLKHLRETVPAVASYPSAPPKKLKAAVETIKEAKSKEFPVKPAPAAPAKKKMSKTTLRALLEELSSDEE